MPVQKEAFNHLKHSFRIGCSTCTVHRRDLYCSPPLRHYAPCRALKFHEVRFGKYSKVALTQMNVFETSAPKLVFNSSKGKMNIAQASQDLVHMTYKHFSYLSIVRLMSEMTKFVPDLHGLSSQTDTQECLPFLPVWFWVGSQLSPPWRGRWTLRKQIQILNAALYVQHGHIVS